MTPLRELRVIKLIRDGMETVTVELAQLDEGDIVEFYEPTGELVGKYRVTKKPEVTVEKV